MSSLPAYDPYRGQSIADESLKRAFLGHFQRTAAENCAEDTDAILDGTALTDEAQTVTTFLAQPNCAKNLTVTGGAANMAGDVVITGLNAVGDEISETFTLSGTSKQVGSKAFVEVARIALPAKTTAGDTVDVGYGVKLGLPVMLAQNTVIKAVRDTSTSDSGTVAVSSTAVENNTYTAGATAKSLDVWLLIN